MKLRLIVTLAAALMISGCAGSQKSPESATQSVSQELKLDSSNPFAHENTLPYQAPEYDKIKTEHFVPALKAGMAQQIAEIEQIANQKDEPTFENTIVAMQKTGRLFYRVAYIFDNLTNAYTNDDLKAAENEMAPLFAAHDDAIYLNDKLFARVEKVYNQKDSLNLDNESARLLEKVYKDFVRSGAKLDAAQKERIKQINAELSSIGTKFGQNILFEMNSRLSASLPRVPRLSDAS